MFPETISDKLADIVVKQSTSLSAEERLALLLQYATKAQALWLAKGANGFVMIENGDDIILPVWPHADLVMTWDVAAQSDVTPEQVTLSEFLNTWLPGLQANQTGICVFPLSQEDAGIFMTAEELKQSLEEEAK